jgi:hypothetical protein
MQSRNSASRYKYAAQASRLCSTSVTLHSHMPGKLWLQQPLDKPRTEKQWCLGYRQLPWLAFANNLICIRRLPTLQPEERGHCYSWLMTDDPLGLCCWLIHKLCLPAHASQWNGVVEEKQASVIILLFLGAPWVEQRPRVHGSLRLTGSSAMWSADSLKCCRAAACG